MRAISATRWPASPARRPGILKPGVPAVIGPQQPEALAVIEARAAEIGAPLLLHGRDWDVRGDRGRTRGRDRRAPARAAAAGAGRRAPDRQCRARGGGGAAAARGRARRARRSDVACARRAGRPACSGWRPGRWSRPSRPAPRSGSTAATTRRPARCWPRACRACSRAPGVASGGRHAVDQGSRRSSWHRCCRWRRACASCRSPGEQLGPRSRRPRPRRRR